MVTANEGRKGIPTVAVDFETYYDQEFSLSKLTTEQYIRDDRFEVIGVSTKVGDGPTQWVTGTDEEIRAHLRSLPFESSMALAHNTLFDGAILSWIYGIYPKAYGDTLSMARAWLGTERSVSLRAVAEHYGLGEKGFEVENAKGKRKADFTSEQMEAYGRYCVQDVDLMYEIYKRIRREGFPAKELRVIDMTLRMFTEPKLYLDVPKLRKHRDAIAEHKQQLLESAGVKDKKDLMSNAKFAELLRERGVEPPMKISPTTGKETYAFAKSDEDFLALQSHQNPEIAVLVATRLGVKSTLEETRTERFLDIASRGSFPVPLRYYGAHTGRWSGSDKVNLQNLPSRGGPYAKVLKDCIVPPDGYMIVDCDASQIEARVLAWFAEQEDLVEAFANREDVYKKMASSIYNVPVEEITKQQRQVGKVAILGCGYGVGGAKFQTVLKLMGGVDVSEDESHDIVKLYRKTNGKIQQLWWDAGDVLDAMVKGKSRALGREGVVEVDGENEAIWLPNGLPILYPGLSVKRNDTRAEYSYEGRRKQRKYIYGGKCLAGDTEVLTDRGWTRIDAVTTDQRVWDGVQWVQHDGLTFQGYKPTTVLNGVRMTPDHKVLTEGGWRDASSCEGLHRAGFWLPDGSDVSGDKRETLNMGVPLCMRSGGSPRRYRRGEVCEARGLAFLRMQARGKEQNARLEQAPSVRGLACYEGSVRAAVASSVAKLRGAGDISVSAMEGLVRSILGGHGPHICAGANLGSGEQRRRLHAIELSLGDNETAVRQPSEQPSCGHRTGARDDGCFKIDSALSVDPRPVYDLLNAGPNSRFVVRGASGPFLVHNCIENITQALARCIIAEQMLLISKRYRVALTVHDSVVAVIREQEIKEGAEYIMQCMRSLPKWADGLPIDCEAEVGYTYGNLTEYSQWLKDSEQ